LTHVFVVISLVYNIVNKRRNYSINTTTNDKCLDTFISNENKTK